jgi:hypothetical protein
VLVVAVAVAPVPGAANVPLAPLPGAVKVIETPETPLPLPSVTLTAKAAKAVFTATLCEPPPEITIFDAGPGKLVSANVALVNTPVTEAVTEYGPATVFAVNVGALATPLALVFTVIAVPPLVPPAKVPLAPVAGAVNVTAALLIGFPPLSFTVACNVAKFVLITTLCVAPPVAVMDAAGPVVFVILKLPETTPAPVPAVA